MSINSKDLQDNGTQFYPVTHIDAVIDGNGNKLSNLLYDNFRLMAYAFDQVQSETTVTDPVWVSVVTDYDGRILAGEKLDGTVFFAGL